MIADLKPYTEYKESGSPWLESVPAHWAVHNLRTLIRKRNERNRPDLPLLSVAREKGVFVRSLTDVDENHNVIPEDLSNYKVASTGNLVINKMKAWQGSMGIAPCDGIVSPAYFVFDFNITNRAFGQALLRSKPYVAHFGQASDGVRVGQWDLTLSGMRQIPILVPPSDEQAAIVRFLDHANHRLEKAIRAKRKVIALLNEQKLAIIHRAVTRGLDPNVPLKPSGIPWLGDIPKHWEVRPLKHWAKLNNQTLSDKVSPEYKFRYIDIGTVGTGRLVRKPVQVTFKQAPSRARRVLRQGDTIISTVRTYLKAVYFVDTSDTDLVASTGFAVLSPGSDVLPEFLSIGVQSPAFIDRVTANSIGIAYPAIAESRLGAFHLAIPPNKTEQAAILQYVRSSSLPFDTTIARTEREIALLREYRTRLIVDVVTGKLDVREAARNLPVEAETLATSEEVEPGEIDELEEIEE